jgi:hypothetical protein
MNLYKLNDKYINLENISVVSISEKMMFVESKTALQYIISIMFNGASQWLYINYEDTKTRDTEYNKIIQALKKTN